MFIASFSISCESDDEDAFDCNNTTAYEAALEGWLEDALVYAFDPSATACATLKSSSTTLRELTVDAQSCFDGAEYQDLIDGLDEVLVSLDC